MFRWSDVANLPIDTYITTSIDRHITSDIINSPHQHIQEWTKTESLRLS